MERKRLSRQESRLKTREQLLEAAAHVFSQRGFAAASVEEIAEEAGFSKGAVYSNFASKEELFLALLDRHLSDEFDHLSSRFRQESTGQTFVEVVQTSRTWNILTLEFFLYALRHPAVAEQLAARYSRARSELTALLAGSGDTETAGLPAPYAAWVLPALGLGLAFQAYLEPGALPPDLYRATIEQLLGTASES